MQSRAGPHWYYWLLTICMLPEVATAVCALNSIKAQLYYQGLLIGNLYAPGEVSAGMTCTCARASISCN